MPPSCLPAGLSLGERNRPAGEQRVSFHLPTHAWRVLQPCGYAGHRASHPALRSAPRARRGGRLQCAAGRGAAQAFPPRSEAAPLHGGSRRGGGGAAGGVPVGNLTSLVPVSEALQSDIDRDLHLLVYTNVLQPPGPAPAPRAARSWAAPAAPRSGRPRGDAARPGHGPEKFSPRGSGQACGRSVNDRDGRPLPGLDRSAGGLSRAGVSRNPPRQHNSRGGAGATESPGKAKSAGVMTSPGPRAPVTSARRSLLASPPLPACVAAPTQPILSVLPRPHLRTKGLP